MSSATSFYSDIKMYVFFLFSEETCRDHNLFPTEMELYHDHTLDMKILGNVCLNVVTN